MPRTLTTAVITALRSQAISPALFVEAYFKTGPIRVWTGYGSVSFNAHTWLGVGTLGSLSVIEEGATVEAKGITLTLSGIDPTTLLDALDEFQVGAPVTVYFGLFSGTGRPGDPLVLIPSPAVAWSGQMDQPTIDVAAESAVISINCESRLIEMNNSVQRRYTNEDQQLDFPGDRGFEFVPSIVERNIIWGRSKSNPNNF
jgi:hypothetical protein